METVHHLKLISRATSLGFKASFALLAPLSTLETAVLEASSTHQDPNNKPLDLFSKDIERWTEAARRLDSREFEILLRRTWAQYGAKKFILAFAIPFMRQIGTMWESEDVKVAHEHFASEHLSNFLAAQCYILSSRPTNGRVVVANLEGDHIHMGIRMASVFAALNGFEILFLGANTPVHDIQIAMQEDRVVAAVIGLNPTSDLKRSARMLRSLRVEISYSIKIIVGGNDNLEPIRDITYLDSLERFAEYIETFSAIVNYPHSPKQLMAQGKL